MFEAPLLLDRFLINYHLGHATLAAFVLSIAAAAPLKSRRVLTLVVLLFGVVFFLLPQQVVPTVYRLFGLILVVASPVFWMISD